MDLKQLIIKQAWTQGNLAYKLLPYQVKAYEFIKEWLTALEHFRQESKTNPDAELPRGNMILLECHRRFGKTTVCAVVSLEMVILKPNLLIRFIAPTMRQADEILRPIFDELLLDCPMAPEWKENKKQYVFPNGSKIIINGAENDQMEAQRGLRSDATFVTEIRDITKLQYLVNDILLPQTLTTTAPIFFDSTPAKDMTHYYYPLKDSLVLNNASITFTLDDNNHIPNAVKTKWIEQAGGLESATVQREYFCKRIKDEKLTVIPEWKEDFVINATYSSNFNYYHKYVALDMGVRDNTSVLYAYYDFIDACLYIIDEDVLSGDQLTTEIISGTIKDKEQSLFGNLYKGNNLIGADKVFRRVADNTNPQLLNDLSHSYGLAFIPTTKTNLQAMVNKVRVWVRAGRVKIHHNCKYAIGCIDGAMWQNEKKDDFARSDAFKHYDALAAIVYLVRAIDESTNPLPQNHTGQNEVVFFEKPDTTELTSIQKLFPTVGWMD